jgi:hypothetical protein
MDSAAAYRGLLSARSTVEGCVNAGFRHSAGSIGRASQEAALGAPLRRSSRL